MIPAPSIPNAEDILYSLGNSKFRTSLDLKSGFWQVTIREQDKEKTAFGTDAGLFEWNSMPFGLSSSPSVFQNLINAVLGDVRKFALAFIDDIIVFSDTFEEHLEHLNIVFEKLRQANLRLKISKCEFLKKKLQYLGHVISDQGISVDPHKVDVITKMQPPRTIREVRGFIGMSSYYRKYVPNFSEIARPLIALRRKNVRFEWNDAAQTAFETLKEKLTEAPILAFPDVTKPFSLYTDASQYALGAVLMQKQNGEDRVIQYVSHQFTDAQKKWPTIEREAFAMVYSLQKLRPIILSTKVTIFTDHKPLRHIFTAEMQNARVQRWSIMISEFNCNIEYISEAKNVTADLLSRLEHSDIVQPLSDGERLDWQGEKLDPLEVNVIDSSNLQEHTPDTDPDHFGPSLLKWTEPELIEAQRSDPDLQPIINRLVEEGGTTYKGYYLDGNLLCHVSTGTKTRPSTREQVVIPASFNPRTPDGFGRTPTPGGGGVDFRPPPPYDLENYAVGMSIPGSRSRDTGIVSVPNPGIRMTGIAKSRMAKKQ